MEIENYEDFTQSLVFDVNESNLLRYVYREHVNRLAEQSSIEEIGNFALMLSNITDGDNFECCLPSPGEDIQSDDGIGFNYSSLLLQLAKFKDDTQSEVSLILKHVQMGEPAYISPHVPVRLLLGQEAGKLFDEIVEKVAAEEASSMGATVPDTFSS